MIPVTYLPVATQHQFARNRELIQGKPYERYFTGDLCLHQDVLPATQRAMDPAEAVLPNAEGLSSLLDPGYHPVENGFCDLGDGTAYVASRVEIPGCTGEMYRWWFWWHLVEPARYSLWYPHSHVGVRPRNRDVLTRPGLTHEQRYVGNACHNDEYLGDDLHKIAIEFVEPAELGFDTSRFAEAGVVGCVCARVGRRHPPLQAGTMLHLARQTDRGIEQRSRYWIGHNTRLRAFNHLVDVDRPIARLGLKRHLAGERLAYDLFLHNQIEFTHLSTFLPNLYDEFGDSRDATGP